jgi:lactoylglutathione lyase
MVKIDHMAFEVSDMDKSIQFYTETLGLRLLFRQVNTDVQEDYALLALEGGNLELIQRLDGPFEKPEIRPHSCPHLALVSEDMAETLKMIEENHLTVVQGLREVEGEEKWIYISDPDNNVIEYIQWLKK